MVYKGLAFLFSSVEDFALGLRSLLVPQVAAHGESAEGHGHDQEDQRDGAGDEDAPAAMACLQGLTEVFLKHGAQNEADDQRGAGDLEDLEEQAQQTEEQHTLHIKDTTVGGVGTHAAHDHDARQQDVLGDVQQLYEDGQAQTLEDEHEDGRNDEGKVDALHALPDNCWFVNYLRCHDDIGWGLDEAVENRLGIDPQKHKEYLYHFYEGNFPGSWAKGELYNYDPATGDARSCGTTASLCGIEQALEKDDKTALDYAVKRDLLLHTAMAFLQGFPMLNCGDEIAQLNGWDYKNDPDRVEDSRNLHRTKFNWENAKQRTQKGTLQNQLWQGMEQLRKMRADPCFAPDAWVTTWDSHNPGVLALVRKRGEETLVGLFNFTEYPAGANLDALGGEYHTPEGTSVWLADVELEPYQAMLVKNK